MVNASEADWFHIDIMDGVFVPNISYGMPVLSVIQKHATKPLDVHLMIVDPSRYISTFAKLGSDILTVHYEACTHLHRTLQAIKAEGMKASAPASTNALAFFKLTPPSISIRVEAPACSISILACRTFL